jgi:hypothetical protein
VVAEVTIQVRCYEELNVHLSPDRQKKWFTVRLEEAASVRELLSCLKIPESEVDLVLVNGETAGRSCRLEDRDRVSIYPMFESLDIASLNRLRPRPLRRPAFAAGSELAGLARELEARGLNVAAPQGEAADPEALIRLSLAERRILLTRDPGLAGDPRLERLLLLRSSSPREQVEEVLRRLHLTGKTAGE